MEFKKLSNVEVVAEPSESANVLIEENGIIKKAPKSKVSNNQTSTNGIGSYYIIMEYDGNVTNFPFVSEGLYEGLTNMLTNFIPINLTIYDTNKDNGIFNSNRFQTITSRLDDLGCIAIELEDDFTMILVYPDRLEYDYWG